MAGDVKVVNIGAALSTVSGGTTDFVKAGFGTPLACRITVSFDAVDDTGVAVESKVSIGFSDFTNDFCITHQDEDASAKVDCDARKSNTRSYVVINSAGAVLFSGTASAITDGVRLTHTAGEAPASAFLASVTLVGGADAATDLRRTEIASAQNGTATITHAGLTDGNEKLIFFIGTDIAGEDSSSSGINSSYGVCHISGSDAGGYTFVQRCIGWASDHNNTVGSPHAIISTDRVLDMITEAGVQDWGLEVTAFSSSGGTITVTTRDNGSGAGMEVYSLIVDLDDRKAKVGSVDGPTSGAIWDPTVSLTFTPQWVDLLLTDLTSENAIASDAEAGVMGISSNTGPGEETCHSWYNEDASAAANTNNLFRSRAIDLRDHDVSTVLQDHSHFAFDSTGWTYTINAENETVAKKWVFCTIEEATVAAFEEAINIGLTMATDVDADATFEAAMSLGSTMAVSLVAENIMDVAMSLASSMAIGTEAGLVFEAAMSLASTMAIAMVGELAFNEAISLGSTMATDVDADAVYEAAMSLASTMATDADADNIMEVAANLASTMATDVDADVVFEAAMSLASSMATGIEGGLEFDEAVSLASAMAISLAAEHIVGGAPSEGSIINLRRRRRSR